MYKLFFDGACNPNPGPTGCGAVIFDSQNNVVAELSIFNGQGTNNQAEYNALIYALEKAHELGVTQVKVYGDSKLVINQLNGVWNCNDNALRLLQKRAMKWCYEFEVINLSWIKRADNSYADKLSQQALENKTVTSSNCKSEVAASLSESSSMDEDSYTADNVITIDKPTSLKIDLIKYFKGVGFAIIQDKRLYSINLSPLSCSCGKLKCEHIDAAIEYSKNSIVHQAG